MVCKKWDSQIIFSNWRTDYQMHQWLLNWIWNKTLVRKKIKERGKLKKERRTWQKTRRWETIING